MKQLYLINFLLFSQLISIAQDKNKITTSPSSTIIPAQGEDEVHLVVDEKARLAKRKQIPHILRKKLKYPMSAIANETEGRVLLQFIVEKNGSITYIQVISPLLGNGLENEAIRVIKLLPKFQPAIHKGQPVRSLFEIPIHFKLPA